MDKNINDIADNVGKSIDLLDSSTAILMNMLENELSNPNDAYFVDALNRISESASEKLNRPVEVTREQCLDGIDNDGDGFTDLADPHCALYK